MQLKHIELVEGRIIQDARQVRTKFSKGFPSYFFRRRRCRSHCCGLGGVSSSRAPLGADDPIFPATHVTVGSVNRFEAIRLARKCWSNATPIRTIFKAALRAAGLRYFSPHSLRKTLARLGQETCKSPEEFKACSQNLGHESVMTTFASYGQVDAR
jgi:integrase